MKVGLSERTLRRWLSLPDFQESYRAAQAQQLDSAMNVLRERAEYFARVIVEVAEDEEQPGSVRFQAASKGLELLMRVHGTHDLEKQLDELEASVAQMQMENQR